MLFRGLVNGFCRVTGAIELCGVKFDLIAADTDKSAILRFPEKHTIDRRFGGGIEQAHGRTWLVFREPLRGRGFLLRCGRQALRQFRHGTDDWRLDIPHARFAKWILPLGLIYPIIAKRVIRWCRRLIDAGF